MEPNYEYVVRFIAEHAPGGKSLDYGCGGGEIVAAGREQGLDVHGADPFYEGGSRKADVEAKGLLGTIIKEISDDRTDFPDDYFDVVVSNQVIEHVENLDAVLTEMHRVLKPGGASLHLFPIRAVWVEPHCGIPFLHRFPKASSFRVYYAWAWTLLGLGHHREGKTRMEWSRNFCDWLDKYTHYRSRREITSAFRKHFDAIEYDETPYLDFRLERSGSWLRPVFGAIARVPILRAIIPPIVRRRAGVVCVVKKH